MWCTKTLASGAFTPYSLNKYGFLFCVVFHENKYFVVVDNSWEYDVETFCIFPWVFCCVECLKKCICWLNSREVRLLPAAVRFYSLFWRACARKSGHSVYKKGGPYTAPAFCALYSVVSTHCLIVSPFCGSLWLWARLLGGNGALRRNRRLGEDNISVPIEKLDLS